MSTIIILDYNLGNLFSLKNACEYVGINVTISSESEKIKSCRLLILPGVGAFAEAIYNLKRLGLLEPVIEHARQGKPLIGICLGMQLLFSRSEEFGNTLGLGLVPGVVKRLPDIFGGVKLIVPHVGWNSLTSNIDGVAEPLFSELTDNSCVYFTHSFYVEPEEPTFVTALAEYQGFSFCAAIRRNNIVGMQFHPEKSGQEGLKMLANIKKEVW